MGHAESPVQMLVHGYVAAGQGAPPTYPLDLQGQVLEADGVVAVDRTLELQREDQIQVAARRRRQKAVPRCAAGT